MKKGAIVIILLAIIYDCCAQTEFLPKYKLDSLAINRGDNLVYFVENYSGEKNQYLVPFIESELKNLKDKTEGEELNLFQEVKSLNLLVSGEKTNQNLIQAIGIFNKNNIDFNTDKNAIKQNALIVEKLKDQDWFLKININTLNNLIEYQFVLFKIEKPLHRHTFPFIKLDNYRTTSIFIDPTSLDYKDKIKRALRQVIIEANRAPVPYLVYKNKKASDTIIVEPGHITLAADATDEDSSPDQLTYKWELSQAGSKFVNKQSGKKFNIDLYKPYVLNLLLIVNDGVNYISKKYILLVVQKPTIAIWQPTEESIEFNNYTYHLYANRRFFNFIKFPGLFNISDKTQNVPKKDNIKPDWSKLIPEIRFITVAGKEEQIAFSMINYKVEEDSISNYKEKLIPFVSLAGTPWKLTDEGSLFNLRKESIKPYHPDSNYIPPYYIHTYAIYVRKNQTKNIKTGTIKSFKITAQSYNDSDSENFQIQFHRISRTSLFFDETLFLGLQNAVDNHLLSFFTLGVGGEYLIIPQISVATSFGGLAALIFDGDVNSNSAFSYYYKITANFNILNFRNKQRVFLNISDFNRAAFQLKNYDLLPTNHHPRLGLGLSVQPVPYNNYYFNPYTFGWFVSFYPKTNNFNSSNLELGIKANFFIVK